MIDVEDYLREELELPATDPSELDWEGVLVRAGEPARRRRRRAVTLALVSAALVALAATPLGAAIVSGVGDFSSWLRGTPGQPVSAEEQRAFEKANERSWVRFPGSPQLRQLAKIEVDGVSYRLLGFRSGDSLCLRVSAEGAAQGTTMACAPVGDLRNDDAPVRVLLADWGVGRGEKTRTVGFDTLRAPYAQVTAGIAADRVESVELVDDAGVHEVETTGNAFLFVAAKPDAGQRVTHVRAKLAGGGTVGVPVSPSPFGIGGGFAGGAGEPAGPTRVEREVRGGTIAWFDRREQRGEPLDVLPERLAGPRLGHEWGRVLTPDPASPTRVALTIATLPGHPHATTDGKSLCYTLISRGSASTACGPLEDAFTHGPFSFGYSGGGAGDQYVTFSGIASDDVARLEIFTSTGNRIDVALRDNVYLAEVALARLPVKLVAYDHSGLVIGIEETPRDDGPATVVGAPIAERRLEIEGVGSIHLRVHRTAEGGQCWFSRSTGEILGNLGGCAPARWNQAPIRVSVLGNPPAVFVGRVRGDIDHVIARYSGGFEQRIEPDRLGYVLAGVHAAQRQSGQALVELRGIDADGKVVTRQQLQTQPGVRRR